MPYILQKQRDDVDNDIKDLITSIYIAGAGEKDAHKLAGILNYSISTLLLDVFDLKDSPSYSKFNTAIGILEAVKLEMYRRAVAPYEDKKIDENGDII